ncbi:hypothetical protein RJ641_036159 [Dillenia turbinata]|uniref:Uncharacterized protein n=1 Tax=Dillenia turbinata TaxID=194707 RepID=A0AAN8VFE8_9MAGN
MVEEIGECADFHVYVVVIGMVIRMGVCSHFRNNLYNMHQSTDLRVKGCSSVSACEIISLRKHKVWGEREREREAVDLQPALDPTFSSGTKKATRCTLRSSRILFISHPLFQNNEKRKRKLSHISPSFPPSLSLKLAHSGGSLLAKNPNQLVTLGMFTRETLLRKRPAYELFYVSELLQIDLGIAENGHNDHQKSN